MASSIDDVRTNIDDDVPARPLVCAVDGNVSCRKSIEGLLREEGFEVETFESAESFLGRPRPQRPACLIADLALPGISGLDLHEELARCGIDVRTIILTGHADVCTSVRAMKAGVLDFLAKPCRRDVLLAAVREAVSRAVRERRPGGLVGESEALRKVLSAVDLVADTDATVLITGETGTGKELVA